MSPLESTFYSEYFKEKTSVKQIVQDYINEWLDVFYCEDSKESIQYSLKQKRRGYTERICEKYSQDAKEILEKTPLEIIKGIDNIVDVYNSEKEQLLKELNYSRAISFANAIKMFTHPLKC